VPYTITNSGSYYLTANFTVDPLYTSGTAISINVSDVTLDLNGFTLFSYCPYNIAAGGGVTLASGLSDITILNGHISSSTTYNGSTFFDSGFEYGINYLSNAPANVRVSGVSVTGCAGVGISLGGSYTTVVDSCSVRTIGGYGIEAGTVLRSTADLCGNTGIMASTASDCYGYSINGTGVDANNAFNCYGVSDEFAINIGAGIGLSATIANNCCGITLQSYNGYGLNANSANTCYGYGTLGNGLYAMTANGCYGVSVYGDGGDGVDAIIANNCYGSAQAGSGVSATQIAIGCYGSGGGDGPNSAYAPHTYNMPQP
jgi:hypothetical protein